MSRCKSTTRDDTSSPKEHDWPSASRSSAAPWWRRLAGLPVQTTSEGDLVYTFPKECVLRTETASRWQFAMVIAYAVAFICLWGTIIGSMLPLVFHQIGADPALASSPFVATFVDVTGIFAYFTIATLILLDRRRNPRIDC